MSRRVVLHRSRVVPAIRWGKLVRLPRLKPHQLSSALHGLTARWGEIQKDLLAFLSELQDGPWEFVSDGEPLDPWTSMDQGTPVITFPRCQNASMDMRVCIAVCPAAGQSTKVWARVGARDRRVGIKGALAKTSELYREVARKSASWIYERFKEELEKLGLHPKPIEEFEVAALATSNPKIAGYLEELEGPGSGKKVAKHRVLRQLLSGIAGKDSAWQRAPSGSWFTATSADPMSFGSGDVSEMLYVMSPMRDRTQFLGIGFDAREEGSLASESTLTLGRFIARRV